MEKIRKVKLGSQGLMVPVIGLGCMGMTDIGNIDIYGKGDEKEAIATIHRSLELGGNFLDTAELYGPLKNERLIARAIQGRRNEYIIASKFGVEIDDAENVTWKMNGSKEYARKALERSLKNLGTDHIDLYYLHRLDPNTPIEETVSAMAEFVKEGKVRYIGLSEMGSATIRKAHQVHPISALQTEYSLFERSVEEEGILDTLHELGIGFVAYSPLGRGFLNGQIQKPEDLGENDFRRSVPKFQGEQFYKNVELVRELTKMATEKGITTAQLAIAWTIAKGSVPIPGTKRIKYLEQNIAAAGLVLSESDLGRLESIIPLGTITGERYDANGMATVGK